MATFSTTTTTTPRPPVGPGGRGDIAALTEEIRALRGEVAYLAKRQRRFEELAEQLMPITRQAMEAWGERLEDLEKKGYVAFGKEALKILDNIVEGFEPEDVRQLGDNIVTILDTVKNITQPDVLEMVNEAADVLHDADGQDPKGMLGMLKASRDKDVRKGMGVVFAILKQIGRAAPAMRAASRGGGGRRRPSPGLDLTAPRRAGLSKLAPSRRPALPDKSSDAGAACASTLPPQPSEIALPPTVAGVALGADGFIADPQTWTKAFAAEMAALMGVSELGEGHWKVIDFARAHYLETGASPNVRRMTKGAGLTTKDLYTLFPKSPGKAAARCAGIPKPVGCI